MHKKFQCHYKLMLNWYDNGQPKQAVISDPITIEFNIVKSTRSQNSTTITIYNLDKGTREALYQDIIILNTNETVKWVTLEAGYGEQLAVVSMGYVKQCFSHRNGADFITQMEVIDPDILTEYTGVTFEAGTTFQQAYDYLLAQLPSLRRGETGVLEGEFKIPTVFDGNTFILMNRLTGGHTFVDNKVINTLGDRETLSDYGCYYIAADTGLLETPKRYDTVLEVTMLFEPTIKLGQMVDLRSSAQARFNGQYKVLGINHNCLISGASDGIRTTTLQLQYIIETANTNVNLTQNPEGAPPSVVKNNKVEPINVKYTAGAESIYKQIKKFNGRFQNNPITRLIGWKDMIYPGGTKNKPEHVVKDITLDKLARCEAIAIALTDFVGKHFKGKKIKVTSGYRTAQNNASNEASSNNSNHRIGAAIDFYLEGVPMSTLRKVFSDNWGYGLGIYLKNNFIHVSTKISDRTGKYERFVVKEKV